MAFYELWQRAMLVPMAVYKGSPLSFCCPACPGHQLTSSGLEHQGTGLSPCIQHSEIPLRNWPGSRLLRLNLTQEVVHDYPLLLWSCQCHDMEVHMVGTWEAGGSSQCMHQLREKCKNQSTSGFTKRDLVLNYLPSVSIVTSSWWPSPFSSGPFILPERYLCFISSWWWNWNFSYQNWA